MHISKRSAVLQELHRLNKLHAKTLLETVLWEMESILESYLQEYPNDTDMWLRLAMVEFTPPLEDYERIEKYIEAILKYDPTNIKGILVLAYVQYILRGKIYEELFVRLKTLCVIEDKEWLSMIYLAMAWYYETTDEEKYEQLLLESIRYCDKHVNNFDLLGGLYLKTGRGVEGKKILQFAISNVQEVTSGGFADVDDVEFFFNERFKGTYITRENLRFIYKSIEQTETDTFVIGTKK